MRIAIRKETIVDYPIIFEIIRDAFPGIEHSGGDECFIVERLRKNTGFVPELSLVEETDGEVVGHILFSKIKIQNGEDNFEVLSLASVSVKPGFQNKGIGSSLIREGLKIATETGHTAVIVLGHPEYYPRFGFKMASSWKIKAPFEVPDEVFMAMELLPGSLANISGAVIYPKEFFE